jgi:hypothetical protein
MRECHVTDTRAADACAAAAMPPLLLVVVVVLLLKVVSLGKQPIRNCLLAYFLPVRAGNLVGLVDAERLLKHWSPILTVETLMAIQRSGP